MKFWKVTKAVLYILAGVVIIVGYKVILPYAGYVVGGIVFAYALEELIILAVRKEIFGAGNSLVEDIVQIVIALLLIFSGDDVVKVCLIWGMWSIIRESREMTEALKRVLNKRSGLISIIESVVVIGMSVAMVIEPGEGHVVTHTILLGIELILEIVFPLIDYLFDKNAKKKSDSVSAEESEKIAA